VPVSAVGRGPGLMRLTILAVGRLRKGPEKALIDDRLGRFDATGRALGLGPARVVEVEDKRRRGPEPRRTCCSPPRPKVR
jgi:hypothetical protein